MAHSMPAERLQLYCYVRTRTDSVQCIYMRCTATNAVEWAIGEAAGALAAFCLQQQQQQGAGDLTPRRVYESPDQLAEFQRVLRELDRVELEWPMHVHEEALALYRANPMLGDQLREQIDGGGGGMAKL